jgi:hypothetical protein
MFRNQLIILHYYTHIKILLINFLIGIDKKNFKARFARSAQNINLLKKHIL